MFAFIMFIIGIMFVIRYFFKTKIESELAKENYQISRKEYYQLVENLKKLSPLQMQNLQIEFEEWVNERKK